MPILQFSGNKVNAIYLLPHGEERPRHLGYTKQNF